MNLYHGTNQYFDTVLLSESRLGKDFGFGFYLTPEFDVAKRQSERKYAQLGEGNPTVIKYVWDEGKIGDLNILRFDKYSIEWAEFILMNRKNKKRNQLHNYDIVIGPIADDTVGFQIRRYEDGIISIQQFMEEIKFHKVTMQYLFATKKSLYSLKRL